MRGRQRERLDTLQQDVPDGWRLLLRTPVFSATDILPLALPTRRAARTDPLVALREA